MMKRLSWRLTLAAACVAFAVFGGAKPLLAADEGRGGPVDRLERLEQRVNQMAEHQEQLMRRLGAQMERRAPMNAPLRNKIRRQAASPDRARVGRPMPPVGAPAMARPPVAPEPPHAVAKPLKDIAGLVKLCLLVAFIFNILLAIWIFTDIRKRGEGSGIFIALALLAGIPAAIIYSIVRIGDKKT
jgi:hypothetical protein